MANRRRGLLFDLDGTIADTLPLIFRAFRHALEPWMRRPPTEHEMVATFGPPERDCIEQMLRHPEISQPGATAQLDAAERRFHTYYRENHGGVLPFPGIREALEHARRWGWKVAVFTGKGHDSGDFTLQSLGLRDQVDLLVGGDDVRRGKPDPEGVVMALGHFRLAPEQFLVIGDSPLDILASRGAGTESLAALWGAHDPAATRAAGPTWVLESSNELAGFLAQLP